MGLLAAAGDVGCRARAVGAGVNGPRGSGSGAPPGRGRGPRRPGTCRCRPRRRRRRGGAQPRRLASRPCSPRGAKRSGSWRDPGSTSSRSPEWSGCAQASVPTPREPLPPIPSLPGNASAGGAGGAPPQWSSRPRSRQLATSGAARSCVRSSLPRLRAPSPLAAAPVTLHRKPSPAPLYAVSEPPGAPAGSARLTPRAAARTNGGDGWCPGGTRNRKRLP